jgi:hypothetical protein
MDAPGEAVSSIALLVPAAFAATQALKGTRSGAAPLAAAHAAAIFVSAVLSISYWTTGDRHTLRWDRVAARVRVAVDVAALTLALTISIRASMLPLGLALLAAGLYSASCGVHHRNGDARIVSLLHTTFHVIGAIGEIALIRAAY